MRAQSLALVSLIVAALLLSIPFSYVHAQTYPKLVTVASDGTQGNGGNGAFLPISADGRYVVFPSHVSNLVPNDTNGFDDAFIHDMLTGSTTRASIASDGTQGNHFSSPLSISADGRYVVFVSLATNLVPNDTNNTNDIFLHDALTGSTTRVSVSSDGTQGNNVTAKASISADGRYVVFDSSATNLVPNDTNVSLDVFIRDTLTGTTTRVSVASDGTQSDDNSGPAFITSDGRYVVFASLATNLAPNDTNATTDTFVHDTLTGSTTRVGNGVNPSSISADGRYVAFFSSASNLVPNDTNTANDTFVHDTLTGSTTRVSVASDGTEGNDSSQRPSISADGRYVAFASDATNFAQNDTNNTGDIFLHDTITGTTVRVSEAPDGTLSNGDSFASSISGDGRYVTFVSFGNNLVPNDTNNTRDVFLTQNPLHPLFVPNNHAPELAGIGNKTVDEGELLQFTVSATDPDNNNLTYSASNLPPGASFDAQTRTFSWTPSFSQAGNYENIEFTVTDDGSPMQLAFEDITITVGDVNRPPVFDAIGSQQVLEHTALTFTVNATDPDGNAVTLFASGMPSGATFDSNTGVFSWTPGGNTAGVYTPAFTAVDDGTPIASSTTDVVITVGSNPTPTEQAQNIINVVVAANLPNNVENSYLANLNKVGTFIENGNVNAAINQLDAFINKVEQDFAHNNITQAQRDQFVALGQHLIDILSGN